MIHSQSFPSLISERFDCELVIENGLLVIWRFVVF